MIVVFYYGVCGYVCLFMCYNSVCSCGCIWCLFRCEVCRCLVVVDILDFRLFFGSCYLYCDVIYE